MSPVASILDREIKLVSRFLALLGQEQEALKSANPTALPEIGREKNLLVEQLNSIEAERNRALGEPYARQGKNGMLAWLAAHADATECGTLWQELLAQAQEARQMHQLNAGLLALHINKTNEALAILTRHNNDHTLYGANGQTAAYTGSRIVDSA